MSTFGLPRLSKPANLLVLNVMVGGWDRREQRVSAGGGGLQMMSKIFNGLVIRQGNTISFANRLTDGADSGTFPLSLGAKAPFHRFKANQFAAGWPSAFRG
jgi:hypothetical protein